MPNEISLDITADGAAEQLKALAKDAEGADAEVAKLSATLSTLGNNLKNLDTSELQRLQETVNKLGESQRLRAQNEELALGLSDQQIDALNRANSVLDKQAAAYEKLIGNVERYLSAVDSANKRTSLTGVSEPVSVPIENLRGRVEGLANNGFLSNEQTVRLGSTFGSLSEAVDYQKQSKLKIQADEEASANRQRLYAQELAALEAQSQRELDIKKRTQAQEAEIFLTARQKENAAYKEQEAGHRRELEQTIALEDKASLAGLRGPQRVRQEQAINLRDVTDPEQRARRTAAFDRLAQAAEPETPGVNSSRFTKGIAQLGIGTGVLDYRAFYALGALQNLDSASGSNTLGSALPSIFGAAKPAVAAAGDTAAVAATSGGALSALGGISVSAVVATTASIVALGAAELAAASSASQHVRELRNLGEELGTTTQGARELEGAARISGTNIQSLVSGARQLTEGLAEPGGRGKGPAGVLESIGVSPTNSLGQLKDTKDLLLEISDALRGVGDIQARDILEQLFGRGGRQLLPVIRQDLRGLTEEVNQLSGNLDNDAAAIKYAEQLSKLGIIWDGLKQRFADHLFVVVDYIFGKPGANTQSSPFTAGQVTDEVEKDAIARLNEDGVRNLIKRTRVQDLPSVFRGSRLPDGDQILSQLGTDPTSSRILHRLQSSLANVGSEGIRETFETAQSHTEIGLRAREAQLQAQIKSNNALAVAYNEAATADHPARIITDDQRRTAQLDASNGENELKQVKAELKELTAKTSDPTNGIADRLLRERDRAQRGTLYGDAKIQQEYEDSIDELSQQYGHKRLSIPPSQIKTLAETRDFNLQHENERNAQLQLNANIHGETADAQDAIKLRTLVERSSQALSAAQNRNSGTQEQNILDKFASSRSDAIADYNQKQLGIEELRKNLASVDPGNRAEINRIDTEIKDRARNANYTLTVALVTALNNKQIEGVDLDQKRTEQAIKYTEAVERGREALNQATQRIDLGFNTARGNIQAEAATGGLNARLQLLRAGAFGNGQGSTGILANAEQSTRVQAASISLNARLSALQGNEDLIRTNYRTNTDAAFEEHRSVIQGLEPGSDKLIAANESYIKQQETLQIEAANAVADVEKERMTANADYSKELLAAKVDREKAAVEAIQKQNVAVQDVGGSLISAYITAELHRQSGAFPVREALGQQYLKYGEQVGKNLTGVGFGFLQKAGVGQGDIIPGLSTQVPDGVIDPRTNKQRVDANGNPTTKDQLTSLGKAFEGTPLAHHVRPVDPIAQHVATIDSTATSILELLGQWAPNGKPVQGGDPSTPSYAAIVPNPTGGAGPFTPGSGGGGSSAGPFQPVPNLSGGAGTLGGVLGGGSGGVFGAPGGGFSGGAGSTFSTDSSISFGGSITDEAAAALGLPAGAAVGAKNAIAAVGAGSSTASALAATRAAYGGAGGRTGAGSGLGAAASAARGLAGLAGLIPKNKYKIPGLPSNLNNSYQNIPYVSGEGGYNDPGTTDSSDDGGVDDSGGYYSADGSYNPPDNYTYSDTSTDYSSVSGSETPAGLYSGTDALSQGSPVYRTQVTGSQVPAAQTPAQSLTVKAGVSSTDAFTNSDGSVNVQAVGQEAAAAAAAVVDITKLPAAYKNADETSTGAGTVAKKAESTLETAAAVANAVPGGQIVAAGLQIAALTAAGVAAIFGDPRADKIKALNNFTAQNTFTAPSAYNLVTSTNGQSVTQDTQGAPRTYNGSLLAYPNTSAYTIGYDYTFNRGTAGGLPGGVPPVASTILSVEINALDSKSIMDNSDVLTTAVQAAMNNGHPIQNTINNIANTR